jgi:hypothetical protein
LQPTDKLLRGLPSTPHTTGCQNCHVAIFFGGTSCFDKSFRHVREFSGPRNAVLNSSHYGRHGGQRVGMLILEQSGLDCRVQSGAVAATGDQPDSSEDGGDAGGESLKTAGKRAKVTIVRTHRRFTTQKRAFLVFFLLQSGCSPSK